MIANEQLRKNMKIVDRMNKLEQDVEQLIRQTSLKIPFEFHEHLYKNGYYHVVSLNGDDGAHAAQIQIQVLNDRLRMSFDIQGGYRVIQYDFFFEPMQVVPIHELKKRA